MMTRKNLAIILALLCAMLSSPVSAEAEQTQTIADTAANLDAVLVVDCSGSMPLADPDRLALEAGKMFIDMCERESTRIGYVAFSHRIISKMSLTPIVSDADYDAVMKGVTGIKYTTKEDTDISLALTEAQRMQQIGGSGLDRNPLIILLSDGNTDVGQGRRTNEESLAEMKDTLGLLKDMEVPVYGIGLNYNGKLDLDEMQRIADATGGESFEATDAAQLYDILFSIFARHTQNRGDDVPVVRDGDGLKSVITVPNDSILQTNITVLMRKRITAYQLFAPGGIEVRLPSDKFRFSNNETYAVIKMLRPEKGDWVLRLEGEGISPEDVSVKFLSSYEMRLHLEGVDATTRNVPVSYAAYLIDSDDSRLDDAALMESASATLYYQHQNETEIHEIHMTRDGARMVATLTLDGVGRYTVWAQLTGADESYQKVSNTKVLPVTALSLSVIDSGTVKVFTIKELTPDSWLNKMLPFIPSNTFTIPLTSIAKWDRDFDSGINVRVEGEKWGEYCVLQWSPSELKLVGESIKTGMTQAEVQLIDAFGNEVVRTLDVMCLSLYGILGALVVAVLLLLAVIIAIRNAARPPFNGILTVGIELPDNMDAEQPAAIDMPLRQVSKKKPVSLGKVIDKDVSATAARNALSPVRKMVDRTIISPRRDPDAVQLGMPKIARREGVQVNGHEFGGNMTETISARRGLIIEYPMQGGDYIRVDLHLQHLGVDNDEPVVVSGYDVLSDLDKL